MVMLHTAVQQLTILKYKASIIIILSSDIVVIIAVLLLQLLLGSGCLLKLLHKQLVIQKLNLG